MLRFPRRVVFYHAFKHWYVNTRLTPWAFTFGIAFVLSSEHVYIDCLCFTVLIGWGSEVIDAEFVDLAADGPRNQAE
jgi:hypothetical protein